MRYDFLTIDLLLMVSHSCTQKSPYKEERKLTFENNGYLSFPIKRLAKPTLVPILIDRPPSNSRPATEEEGSGASEDTVVPVDGVLPEKE